MLDASFNELTHMPAFGEGSKISLLQLRANKIASMQMGEAEYALRNALFIDLSSNAITSQGVQVAQWPELLVLVGATIMTLGVWTFRHCPH